MVAKVLASERRSVLKKEGHSVSVLVERRVSAWVKVHFVSVFVEMASVYVKVRSV